ncbi:MAG: aldehyde dehydrogenase family protein [Planctomycetota bacterium]
MIGHLLDGERRNGRGGFDVPAPSGGTLRFARATDADLDAALASLEPATRPEGFLREVLEDAIDDLGDDPLHEDELAAALSVPRASLPPRFVDLDRVLDARSRRRPPRRVALAAHWTDGVAELLRRLAGPLLDGSAILLASDVRCPGAADAVAEVLLDAGLPAGRLALLHGLEHRALIERSSGLDRVRMTVDDAAAARALRPSAGERRIALDWPTGAVRRAGSDGAGDPAAAYASAFGAREAFGGQLPGRTAVLEIPVRDHAAWVRALVDLVDRGDATAPPVDREAERRFQALLRATLDQGATLVAARQERGQVVFGPALAVNAELRMDAVREPSCVPLLCVRRVP